VLTLATARTDDPLKGVTIPATDVAHPEQAEPSLIESMHAHKVSLLPLRNDQGSYDGHTPPDLFDQRSNRRLYPRANRGLDPASGAQAQPACRSRRKAPPAEETQRPQSRQKGGAQIRAALMESHEKPRCVADRSGWYRSAFLRSMVPLYNPSKVLPLSARRA